MAWKAIYRLLRIDVIVRTCISTHTHTAESAPVKHCCVARHAHTGLTPGGNLLGTRMRPRAGVVKGPAIGASQCLRQVHTEAVQLGLREQNLSTCGVTARHAGSPSATAKASCVPDGVLSNGSLHRIKTHSCSSLKAKCGSFSGNMARLPWPRT